MDKTELIHAIEQELDRAEKDAEMSANEDDLAYHNGEIDALNWAIDQLKGNKN